MDFQYFNGFTIPCLFLKHCRTIPLAPLFFTWLLNHYFFNKLIDSLKLFDR